MAKQNVKKTPPKGSIRFSISLSEEQKRAKTDILKHPFNFIVGKAGSGKTYKKKSRCCGSLLNMIKLSY